MRRWMIVVLGAAAVAACDGGGAGETAANATNTAAAKPKPKRVPYCFFKDANTKGWAAAAGADGNVTITGRTYIEDARYKGALGPPEIAGGEARAQVTMTPNDTGFASADDWWDVKAVLSGSGGVETVILMCGEKVVATLKVPRKG